MTILINQVKVSALDELPDNIQTLVSLIPYGVEWFEEALTDEDNSLNFMSFDELIEALNEGLRETELLNLSKVNLVVSVQKLLEFTANDLRDLSYLSESDSNKEHRQSKEQDSLVMDRLKIKYKLVDNAFFAKLTQFFRQQKMGDYCLIYTGTLDEKITFYQVILYCEQQFTVSNKIKSDAINWAKTQAQNLSELADYYCFYLAWYHKKLTSGLDVNVLMEQLMPVVIQHLDCPLVTFELDKRTLNDAIIQWNDAGHSLGFSTLSAGLLNTVLNIEFVKGEDIPIKAEEYIKQLQDTLKNHLAVDSYINQAGMYRHYVFETAKQTLILNVNRVGCLSVFSDRPELIDAPVAEPLKGSTPQTLTQRTLQ
ncbi:hypothetical protein [uncultured Shewanella sp.]|uniref:hypothetical protein n=1 Tax=uncultured Shewanella sp. TaxID=173975 RepID=UPI0026362419|nr:hypothetical protein [uncultured Shewanella sp.]